MIKEWILRMAVKTFIKSTQLKGNWTNEEIYWAMKNSPQYWTEEQVKLAKKILKIGNDIYN